MYHTIVKRIAAKNFERVNREREEAGEPGFANPRNSASGGLRALDPEITRRRRLRMFAFTAEVLEGKAVATTQHGLLEKLEEWGFQVEPHHTRAASMDEVTDTPISAITPSATRRVCSYVSFISPTVPVSGIMISGSTRTPCSAAVQAASMIARACMP